MSSAENKLAMDREDTNSIANQLRRLMKDVRQMQPIVARAITKEDLPQEFISPSTPVVGGIDPTDPNFTGSYVSGIGRQFTINGAAKTINAGGVSAGTFQVGWSQDDGKFYAGAGAVTLDADGITIQAGSGEANRIDWKQSTAQIASLLGYVTGSTYSLSLDANGNITTGKNGLITITADSKTSSDASDVYIRANENGSVVTQIAITKSGIAFTGPITTQGIVNAVSTKSGNYTLTTADSVVVFTATATATLPNDPPIGQTYRIVCRAGTLTIDGDGSDTIKGETSQSITAGEDLIITYTATGVWE